MNKTLLAIAAALLCAATGARAASEMPTPVPLTAPTTTEALGDKGFS